MISSQRHLFDIPDEVAYFNCAYMGPMPKASVEAAERAARFKARPWHIEAADFFEDSERARALFARLLGARADDVAIVPAASYGIAVAARNLPLAADQSVVLLAEQFPSNVYAWQERATACGARIVTVGRRADGDLTGAVLAALDERTAIVALPRCHWADGALLDLETIGARCRELGAALVLDLTQSLGALPFDVAAVQPDYVVAACYKWLLGPYTLGFLYAAPHRQQGEPLEHSWIARLGAENFAGLVAYERRYQPGARRYDMGERANFHLLPPAMASLEQILAWDAAAVAETLGARTAALAEATRALGLTSLDDARRAPHFLGLRFPEGLPRGLPDALAAAGVHVSVRGESMRITPHLYNTDEDAARLLDVLARAL